MGILSSGDECYVCGKGVDKDKCEKAEVEGETRYFCCQECKKHYEDEEKEDEKEEVCKFC